MIKYNCVFCEKMFASETPPERCPYCGSTAEHTELEEILDPKELIQFVESIINFLSPKKQKEAERLLRKFTK